MQVGNAVFHNYYDEIGTIEYWWSHSLISDTRYRSVLKNCNFKLVESERPQPCTQAMYHVITELGNIDQYSIYSPICLPSPDNTMSPKRFKNTLLRRRLSEYDPCSANYAEKYYNRPEVQKAMHANVNGILRNWTVCRFTI